MTIVSEGKIEREARCASLFLWPKDGYVSKNFRDKT